MFLLCYDTKRVSGPKDVFLWYYQLQRKLHWVLCPRNQRLHRNLSTLTWSSKHCWANRMLADIFVVLLLFVQNHQTSLQVCDIVGVLYFSNDYIQASRDRRIQPSSLTQLRILVFFCFPLIFRAVLEASSECWLFPFVMFARTCRPYQIVKNFYLIPSFGAC